MRKLIPLLLLTLSASAMAQHYHHGNYGRNWQSNPNWWIAPVVIGGVIGYELNRPQQVVIYPTTSTNDTATSIRISLARND